MSAMACSGGGGFGGGGSPHVYSAFLFWSVNLATSEVIYEHNSLDLPKMRRQGEREKNIKKEGTLCSICETNVPAHTCASVYTEP